MSYISCSKCPRKTLSPLFINEESTEREPLCEVCYRLEMGLEIVSAERNRDILFDRAQFSSSSSSSSSSVKESVQYACSLCDDTNVFIFFTCSCGKQCICMHCYKRSDALCDECHEPLTMRPFHDIQEAFHHELFYCRTCQKNLPRFVYYQHTLTCTDKKASGVSVQKLSEIVYSHGLEFFIGQADQQRQSQSKRLFRS